MPETKAIAIDGPVASGKTAVGRLVARLAGYRFLDTGAMYRAVTLEALSRGTDVGDEEGLAKLASVLTMRVISEANGHRLLLDGRDITDRLAEPDVERGVSAVSRVSGVRTALVAQQRRIAGEDPIVVVGRDIGTVVLPNAVVKVYLTASVQVRATRRHAEMARRGDALDYAHVAEELMRRDKIDSERADSPLRPADDAVLIDTDDLGVEEVARRVLDLMGSGQ